MDINSMNTSYFQFLFTIYFISIDTIACKQHHINRSVDDDPFALDGFGGFMFEFEFSKFNCCFSFLKPLFQLESSGDFQTVVEMKKIRQFKKI
jgi:hypothetical protein